MKPERAEKIVGYVLLTVGLILIITPAILALAIFLSGAHVPQLVPVPAGNESGLTTAIATFSNVCLIFFIFILSIWAGSIISSRGVTMEKDVKLKLVRKSLREVVEAVEKVDTEEA